MGRERKGGKGKGTGRKKGHKGKVVRATRGGVVPFRMRDGMGWIGMG